VKNVNISDVIPLFMKFGKRTIVILLCIFLILLIPQGAFAENTPPTLTGGTVTPRKCYPNIDYLFTVTYLDSDGDIPSRVVVLIDEEPYDMVEVNPSDTNITGGKEYKFKKVMGEGSYSIYYRASDGNGSTVNSEAFTLSVTWDVGHFDIIHFIEEEVYPGLMMLLMVVFILLFVVCLILVFMVLQMRRIGKALEGKVDKEDGGEEEGEEEEK
jgi:hypothetical protein